MRCRYKSKSIPRTPHPPLPWSPFSHRRRLFYLLKAKKITPESQRKPKLRANISASRVILSGGRSPKSNPEGDRRSGSPNGERTTSGAPLPAPRVILSGGRSPKSNPEGDRRSGSTREKLVNTENFTYKKFLRFLAVESHYIGFANPAVFDLYYIQNQ